METGNDPPSRDNSARSRSFHLMRWLLAGAGVALFAVGLLWNRDQFSGVAPPVPVPPMISRARVAEPDPDVIRAVEQLRNEAIRQPGSAMAWGRLGMSLLAHGAEV